MKGSLGIKAMAVILQISVHQAVRLSFAGLQQAGQWGNSHPVQDEI